MTVRVYSVGFAGTKNKLKPLLVSTIKQTLLIICMLYILQWILW